MKLREKLKTPVSINTEGEAGRFANQCEKIADDYAIEFAKWCIEWRVEFCDSTKEGILYTYGGMYQKYTMRELLEIFKKEKGW